MLRVALIASLAFASLAAAAADAPRYALAIKDHKYVPAELTIPANTKVMLVVTNQDPTAEEFESNDLNREKVVVGKSSINVPIGPLKPGRYKFFGDFHQDTAQGVLIAK